MTSFKDWSISKQLGYALDDLQFEHPTKIQRASFPIISSGKDIVGIAQTGTGKTLAYMLPILNDLPFSKQMAPRVLILVPTRELVIQLLDQIDSYAHYLSIRCVGVYGGTNINTQAQEVMQGADILVGTPGRVYDLILSGALKVKSIKRLVIDEVDVMLDLGFRFQLNNIFELLPERRQNIMYSATMTEDVDELIHDFFQKPEKVSIAVSGTPLNNIDQYCYEVITFYTKINLLAELVKDKTLFPKVLVFVSTKKNADIVYERLHARFGSALGVLHSNKSQNFRIRMLNEFTEGKVRIMISTDVMARGLDIEGVTHVINMDVPKYPENYMHRIGRTGRAGNRGTSYLFYTHKEEEDKLAIEVYMDKEIEELPFPEEVELDMQKLAEEKNRVVDKYSRNMNKVEANPAFHEKKEKNKKENLGGSYRREIAKKYKKPKTRGDKGQNKRKKR